MSGTARRAPTIPHDGRARRRAIGQRLREGGDRRRTPLHQSEHGFRTTTAFVGPLRERSAQVAARFTDDELTIIQRFLALTAEALSETGSASPSPQVTDGARP
jgi:hypothetical protein